MKPTQKYKRRILFLTAVILLSGMMAVLVLLGFLKTGNMSESIQNYFATERIKSETVMVILLVAAALPVVIVWMGIELVPHRKKDGEADEVLEIAVGNSVKNTEKEPSQSPKSSHKTKSASKNNGPRFGALTDIDKKMSSAKAPEYDNSLTLSEICERFRMFAAFERNLYYDISDIRRFIAGLGVSPIIIMQGMSGTGKTSLATAFGDFISHDSTIIPIQPMWKERSDMIGYFNEFTERFNETPLLCTLYEANYSKDIYITVLDEMNIARVEYYFADFLSLLELPDKRHRQLDVVSDMWPNDPKLLKNGKLRLPDNMWYIGTANNDDSTFAISDKVYDRAMIINLDKKAKPFVAQKTERIRLSIDYWNKLVGRALDACKMSNKQKANLRRLDAYLIENFHITFGNRIMKQIEHYVPLYMACGGSEEDALDDMISRKLLRKLEMQNPVYIRTSSEGLMSYLDELFGPDSMPECREYLKRLQRNT